MDLTSIYSYDKCNFCELSSLVTCSQNTCNHKFHCSQRPHWTFFPLKCWILQGAACCTHFSSVHLVQKMHGLRDTKDCELSLPGLGSGLACSSLWSLLFVYERRRSLCRPVMEREMNDLYGYLGLKELFVQCRNSSSFLSSQDGKTKELIHRILLYEQSQTVANQSQKVVQNRK